MTLTVGLMSAVLAAIVPMGASHQGEQQASSVAGTWTLTVKGSGAHGDMTASLVLEQEAAKVSGTFSAHGAEHAVKGEFADGTLSLATGDGGQHLTFTATLKADGTLAGDVSGPMGDMQWTATRKKGR